MNKTLILLCAVLLASCEQPGPPADTDLSDKIVVLDEASQCYFAVRTWSKYTEFQPYIKNGNHLCRSGAPR